MITVLIAIGAGAAWVAALQARAWMAQRRLQDETWMMGTASVAEQRQAAHRTLESWFADPHDAFLILAQNGDRSSIPALQSALRGHDDDLTCTWQHARSALESLTSSHAPTPEQEP